MSTSPAEPESTTTSAPAPDHTPDPPEVQPTPILPADPDPPKPIEKSFTTPAGQTVTVVEQPENLPEPAPTIVITEEKKLEDAPAPTATTTTTTVTKSDAATVHEVPISSKTTPPELRKVKTEVQLSVPATRTSVLSKDVGVFKDHIAKQDTTLIWTEKWASTTHEDFRITDEAGKPVYELTRRYFSRTKRLRTSFGRPVLSVRRLGFSRRRCASQWDVLAPDRKHIMSIRNGHEMFFHNFFDNAGTGLFLNGAYWTSEGATLHLGSNSMAPVVAHIESSVVGSMKSPALHQYTLRVVKGFDIALACASIVALDGQRWRDAKKRSFFL